MPLYETCSQSVHSPRAATHNDHLVSAPAVLLVCSFYLRPEGNPDGSNIAIATVNAITMQPPTDGNQRVVNAAVNAKVGERERRHFQLLR